MNVIFRYGTFCIRKGLVSRTGFYSDFVSALSVLAFYFSFVLFPRSYGPYFSRVMRKPDFCICENKDADQLRGNREADQRLCFRYTDSTIPLLPKYEISSL